MSAECDECGTDLRFRGDGWPQEMFCQPCELAAENERLRAALKTHGRHLDTCYRYAWGLLHTEESDCDCKLNAALRGEKGD